MRVEPNSQKEKIMTKNRYHGTCNVCSQRVEAFEGALSFKQGKRWLECNACSQAFEKSLQQLELSLAKQELLSKLADFPKIEVIRAGVALYQGSEEKPYVVTRASCNCKGFRFRANCKHKDEILAWQALEDELEEVEGKIEALAL
jgi:hypothetical protein